MTLSKGPAKNSIFYTTLHYIANEDDNCHCHVISWRGLKKKTKGVMFSEVWDNIRTERCDRSSDCQATDITGTMCKLWCYCTCNEGELAWSSKVLTRVHWLASYFFQTMPNWPYSPRRAPHAMHPTPWSLLIILNYFQCWSGLTIITDHIEKFAIMVSDQANVHRLNYNCPCDVMRRMCAENLSLRRVWLYVQQIINGCINRMVND